MPKGPLAIPEGQDLEITVKFLDGLIARAEEDGTLSFPIKPPLELADLSFQVPVAFRSAFDEISVEKVRRLQKRAAENTGENQADFEGTVVLTLPGQSTREERIDVARAFHKLEQVEYVELVALDNPTPPPVDIAPPTPNLEPSQTYRNSEAASGGGNANYAFSRGFKGQGVRLSDCEYGYNPAHEDLVDSGITDSSRGPFHPTVVSNGWDKHGTASIGIAGATENGYGVTGIAPLAEIHFYSEWTSNGARRRESVTDAIADSAFGDVVLLEMQTGDGQGNFVPAEYNSTIWNLVKAGSDAGVIVVAAAGNGGRNLNDAHFTSYHARGDSGSIIIGAGNQNSSHTRKSFSTYGDRVNVQAWGGGVYSTGYGSHATYGGDPNQRYTRSFNGTSSASAIAAPSVATIQSYCEQELGYRLGPIAMRTLLEDTGVHPATDQKIGPHVNIRNAILYFQPATQLSGSDDKSDHILVQWAGTNSATGYQIYRGDTMVASESTLLATVGNVTQYEDVSVTPGAGYYYFVRPVTPLGPGEWSAAFEGSSTGFSIRLTEATDTGLSDQDGITRDRTPDVSGSSAPNLSVSLTSDLDGNVGTVTADSGGNWTVTLSELSEGTHEIVATEDGGRQSSPYIVEIDVTPPLPPTQLGLLDEDDSGLSNADNITNVPSPRFSGGAPANTRVDLFLDGNPFQLDLLSDGAFRSGAVAVSEGEHALVGQAEDVAGNVSADSQAVAIVIDRTAPGGAVTRAGGQDLSVDSGPFTFDVEFTEPVFGFSQSDIGVGGNAGGMNIITSGGPATYAVRVSDSEAEGNLFIEVTSESYQDIAGNKGGAVSGENAPVFLDFDGVSLMEPEPNSPATILSWLGAGDRDRFGFSFADARHFRAAISSFANAIDSITNSEGVVFFERSGEQGGGSATELEMALPPGDYIIELSNPEGVETGQYEFTLELGEEANSQPDCRIGISVAAAVGNNVYKALAGQIYTLKSKKARRVRGMFAVENDGDYVEPFRIGGGGGTRLFRVIHRFGSQNVTADLLLFRLKTQWVEPAGSPVLVNTEIIPSKKRLIKKKKRKKKIRRKKHRIGYIVAGMVDGVDRSELRVKTR